MKVTVLREFWLDGRAGVVRAGSIVEDMDPGRAKQLIARGIVAEGEAKPAKARRAAPKNRARLGAPENKAAGADADQAEASGDEGADDAPADVAADPAAEPADPAADPAA